MSRGLWSAPAASSLAAVQPALHAQEKTTEAQQLKSKWTLAAGTVFDDSYLDQFRSTVIRPFVTSRTQRTGVRPTFDVSSKPDLEKLAVDVIIEFK